MAGYVVKEERRDGHGPKSCGALSFGNDGEMAGEFLDDLGHRDGATREVDVSDA